MNKEKLAELRQRMHHHTEVCDIAVVVLTARELHELLDLAGQMMGVDPSEQVSNAAIVDEYEEEP